MGVLSPSKSCVTPLLSAGLGTPCSHCSYSPLCLFPSPPLTLIFHMRTGKLDYMVKYLLNISTRCLVPSDGGGS